MVQHPWRTKTKFRTSVKWMPRMAREWHPVEEFTTCMILSFRGIDTSMMSSEDQKDRMLSTMRLYPEKSEGFQGAGGGGSRCAGRLNLFASSCQLGLWLDDKGFLHICSRQTEGFWETANWPRSVPMHGLQCMILLPFKYLHCPCEAACNSSVALRRTLSEACTSNISSSSRQRHTKVAEEPGECWHTPNMPKLSTALLTHAEYAEALDCMVLVVAPDTSPEFGLSGPRHGKTDWPICAERHTRTGRHFEEQHRFIIDGNELEQNGLRGEWQPPPMNLATWPGISCAHDFQSETTETQKLLVSDEMHQKRANIREKGWKVLSDCERLFITGPRECLWNILKKGLSHFDLACKSRRKNQLSPRLVNRTSCVHSEDWCDATWRPTEVYIDFSRLPRRWKRWCLPDNGGR